MEIKGFYDNLTGGSTDDVISAIEYSSNYTKIAKLKNPLSFDDVVNQINNNHPFVLIIEFFDSTRHADVCSGYDLEDETIQVIDPTGLTYTRYYNYAQLLKDAYIPKKEGKCQSQIIY